MVLLACDNAMLPGSGSVAWPSLTPESVGDLAPIGLVLGVGALHILRHRTLTLVDRILVLALFALLGTAVGAVIGLAFRVTALGVFTLPLTAGMAMWLEGRAHLERPRRLPERVWPIDLGARPETTSLRGRSRGPSREPGPPARERAPS